MEVRGAKGGVGNLQMEKEAHASVADFDVAGQLV